MYDGENVVIMLAELHIQMVALTTIRDWHNGICWTKAFSEESIATAGTHDSLIKGANVKRTRHAHQVTSSV